MRFDIKLVGVISGS